MEIGIVVVVWILLMHFFADFVFQTNRQAQEKSSSWRVLGEHVFCYTTIMAVGVMLLLTGLHISNPSIPALGSLVTVWAALNGLCHFAVDAVTSRINSKLYKSGRIHAFFVGVGADQFVHTATLIWTAELFKLGVIRQCLPLVGISV